MRLSKLFFETLRGEPSEAELISHKLMLRSSMMRKLSAGIYIYLPLGYKVIKKVENIIREEMNKAGAQELLMPALQPRELWDKTGRWDVYGPELMRLKDRHNREFCLGPTHEEVITELAKNYIKSYRLLPINLYQIQTKFRDEIRPRFGVMRAREFIMKDAYSFGRDEQDLEIEYENMYKTYTKIFERCGLNFRVVEAETGAIGGDVSHEFMVLANSGEETIFYCDKCNYAANIERAESQNEEGRRKEEELKSLQEVYTPNIKTVEELTNFLNIKPSNIVKTLIYESDNGVIAALISGDDEINVAKLKKVLSSKNLVMADKETIERVTSAPIGFAGPVGLKIKIIADKKIINMKNFTTGGNKKDIHIINVNFNRDFKIDIFADIRVAKEGDGCARCKQGILKSCRGIEVGQIFKLGEKYSRVLNCVYYDEKGCEKYIIMGCYGIGITRTVAAIIEQYNDKDGIIWPISVAPYSVIILPINIHDKIQFEIANEIYHNLLSKNIETLFDDRDQRPGVKFKDADLLGIPIKIIIGDKYKKENKIEIKLRKNNIVFLENIENVLSKIIELVNSNIL